MDPLVVQEAVAEFQWVVRLKCPGSILLGGLEQQEAKRPVVDEGWP